MTAEVERDEVVEPSAGSPYAERMGRPARLKPVQLAEAPWPERPASDPFAEVARQFVVNVRAAMGDRSIRSVAADAGIGSVTLGSVLAGNAWPDLATIARLEAGLNAELWPRRHE
jgi:hypothetical protein